MRRLMPTVLSIFLLLTYYSPGNAQEFDKLEQAYKNGKISADKMMLNKFYYIFNISKIDKDLIPDTSIPSKCGTRTMMEYHHIKNKLSAETIAIIDNLLMATGGQYDYISPQGNFKLSYDVTGDDAVPTEDTDPANGIPDYVEWIAGYLDHAWDVYINQCGYRVPVDTAPQGDGYYNVSFKKMTDKGLTYPTGVDGNEGSRIVLHHNFITKFDGTPFPPNDDPESSQKGRAKVVCAHEFKHAVQEKYHTGYVDNEHFWEKESDATWAEEFVYDDVNDTRLNYLDLTSNYDPFNEPGYSMDKTIANSAYCNYFWYDFLHQKFENNSNSSAPINKEYWERRADEYLNENPFESWDWVLSQHGSSFVEAYLEYRVWNFYTGSLAVNGFGYDEASDLPTPFRIVTLNSYPVSDSRYNPPNVLEHLSCQYIQLNPDGNNLLELSSFDGFPSNNTNMELVMTGTDGNSVFWEKTRLDQNHDGINAIQIGNYGALIPIITDFENSIGGYNYTIIPGSYVNITYTNKLAGSSSNLGGRFTFDGISGSLPSGLSRTLIKSSNQDVTTNSERFLSENVKHHDWDDINSEHKLKHLYQPSVSTTKFANFAPMNTVSIQNSVDGVLNNIGSIDFHDPWYAYSDNSQPNEFISFTLPHSPKGKAGETSGGIFLNQNPNFLPNIPNYSVRALLSQNFYLPQTGQTHNMYFQNWSTNSAAVQQVGGNPSGYDQKAVVFTASGASVQANYKATQLSNASDAYSNNSQRKLVRTKDGWLHQVYTSLGHVWLEHSTDDGTSWFLGNNGQPLDNGAGKCPSIDWHYNTADPNNSNYNSVVITYQQQNGSTYTIEYVIFKYTNGDYVRQGYFNPLYTEPSGGDLYTTTSANPNIAWGGGGSGYHFFALSFERKSTVGSMLPGIYFLCGRMYEGGIYDNPSQPIKISGTTNSSINATMFLNKLSTNVPYFAIFNIVYQVNTSSIINVELECELNQGNWDVSQSSSEISSISGYKNYQPSMIQMPDYSIRLCWIRDLYGGGQYTPYYVNVVYWNSEYSYVYTYSGNMVKSASLNISDDNINSYYAYAQYTNNSTWQNFAKKSSNTTTLTTTGRHIQLSNG